MKKIKDLIERLSQVDENLPATVGFDIESNKIVYNNKCKLFKKEK